MPALAILLQLVSRPNILSSDAFTSLGRLAEAVGPALAKDSNVLEQILSYICNALVVEKKKELDSHNQALTCLRRLVTHAGPAITRVDFTEILTRCVKFRQDRLLCFQIECYADLVFLLTHAHATDHRCSNMPTRLLFLC